MLLELNKLQYGNPTINMVDELSKKSYLDSLFPSLIENKMPENDSDLTKYEINLLTEYLSDIKIPENKSKLNTFLFYDVNMVQAIVNEFQDNKSEVIELIKDIQKDINPLILKLKNKYNRPRPYQLGSVYKIKLFPYKSKTAHTPSYPSGHTIQAAVILNVIGNLIPTEYNKTQSMIQDIANSRLYLGLHFPTDNDFSYEVAEQILKHPEFTKKYGI